MKGKVAIVTGASKGIGLAIVQALVAEGAHVVAGARSSSAAIDELVADGSVTFVAVNLAEVDAAAALVSAAGGRVDILVNNVGATKTRVGGFLSVTDDEWLESLTLNLLAAVRTTRAVLPGMIEAGAGNIVNVASVNAFLPDPAVIDYSAAKAAQLNFAKSLSKEVGPHGIRVNSVSPGPVETDLWLGAGGVAATVSAASGVDPAAVAASAVAGSATQRFTHPSEVADVVLFLAGDRASNITGANITIDGGLVTTL
ncbi:SDR family NAD(P)-dependent oxidoreductase [Subtercola endophyticus]|uniref:SDR family NAD(P)-dependent oxidoreductase n=1 Tax=Subtercola endophyticus TaxID=2895559 RepID=UPI001E57F201|nr:SDR family NAD(P)-dependent oxidoreductase [Subtercola endophyticus]UFS59835.1 SDR family NAD(P)-dependent oxidoreductase [Subtercola endophyticus]